MRTYPNSACILEKSRRFIPGGVVSVNRATQPEIVFERGEGPWIWDADGNQYQDYHMAFAPHFLGHNDPYVTGAVRRVLDDQRSLFGSGATELESRLAELICANIGFVESVQLLNSGSEATYQAIRLARAATGRVHIIVMQGGYNGWHNDVSCNVMTPLERLGPRRSPGEYPYIPISAGIPPEHQSLVHVINYNDLDSVAWVCERYPIAALITEPILQNIGVVKPLPGYLPGLRELADRHGFQLIFDEVKTGFRHAIGGCAEIYGVTPDVAVYGKALANGYPMAALGGRQDLMDYFAHSDPARLVLLAGTYNGHPVPTAAAIATIERLLMNDGEVYRHVETLGQQMEEGLNGIFKRLALEATVVRQGSAFCIYFMDHAPVDWHDLATHHDVALDQRMRRMLIDTGIYVFPLATKQLSISAAHRAEHIDAALEQIEAVLTKLVHDKTGSLTAAVR